MGGEIDILDPDIYVERGVPHDQFARLRAEHPVYFHPEPDGPGFWAVTKYEDVAYVSKHPDLFSSWIGATNIDTPAPGDLAIVRNLMLNMDPPQHNKFRRLVSSGFTPRMVARMEGKIRTATERIISEVSGLGSCDFVARIAAELPLVVIADLMGIPQEDRHKVFHWSNKLIGFDDPEFQNTVEDAQVAAAEMYMYANNLAVEARQKGGNEIINVLLDAEVEGEKLTEPEFDGFFLLLCVAGNETTRNLISGGMLALLEHPNQLEDLKQHPEILPTAVEEMLRWVTPVNHFRRTATQDTEVRGVPIKKGDKVVVFHTSANRDEEVFEHPMELDIRRDPNDHIAFGVGQHACLGMNLARLEIRLMFEELLRRLPDLELAGDVRRLRSNFINGIKEMPVKFTPIRSRDLGPRLA